MSIRVAIVGPTSYTGLVLVQLLLRHSGAKLTYLASQRDDLPNLGESFPQLIGRLPESEMACKPIDEDAMAQQADVAFLCVPAKVAMTHAPRLLEAGLRVIDLSADYRLADADLYEQVYGHVHRDRRNLAAATYGLPELFADRIPEADLVANPGCYPTAAILGIAPLLERSLIKSKGIVINAASGISGAGRSTRPHLHFPEMNEAFAPYDPGVHRHQPEIEQTLSTVKGSPVSVLFVPHYLPVDRGILASIYLDPLDEDVSQEDLFTAFEEAYDDEPFIRVRTDLPNIKHVCDTNFCDVTVRLVNGKAVVFSAIDNMLKGASGQAVQNMNLMFHLDSTTGLL